MKDLKRIIWSLEQSYELSRKQIKKLLLWKNTEQKKRKRISSFSHHNFFGFTLNILGKWQKLLSWKTPFIIIVYIKKQFVICWWWTLFQWDRQNQRKILPTKMYCDIFILVHYQLNLSYRV